MTDDIKAAEQRGYARGYAAGQRRKAQQITVEKRQRQREAFRQRALLAVLPWAMQAQGWKRGDEPITSIEVRVRWLAEEVANQAVARMFP